MKKPSRISIELENLVEIYAKLVNQKLKDSNISAGCVYSAFYGAVYGHAFDNYSIQTYPIVDGWHKDEEVLSIVSINLDGKKMEISRCFVTEPYAGVLSKTIPELKEKLKKSSCRYKKSLNSLVTELETKLQNVSTDEISKNEVHSYVLLKLIEKEGEREFRRTWK